MNELEYRLGSVHETLGILNKAEDSAEAALLLHNWTVREFNYLVFLVNWSRGEPS